MFRKLREFISFCLDNKINDIEETNQMRTKQGMLNSYYAECGKKIFEIERLYPSTHDDAAIIFEEWSRGVLSESRPNEMVLREYARYTADPNMFHEWMKNTNKE